MKKIRMICAALTIAAIGTFGGMAFAADAQPQNTEPVVGGETAVIQEEVAAHMYSGYAEVKEMATAEMNLFWLNRKMKVIQKFS